MSPPARGRDALPPASLDGSPFRWSMGLHRLGEGAWLVVDHQRFAELARKARLLDASRGVVLATLPAGDAPSEELRELVVDELSRHHRDVDLAAALSTDDPSRHPLERASRLVQEDLCVLAHDDGWRLVAACVCFPSRWSLREKLGASLAGIHAPVPGFDDALGGPATRLFDRLAVAQPVWRSNWTLLDTPELHLPAPEDRHRGAGTPGRAAEAGARRLKDGDDLDERLWFRVERQTLRRLASSGAIVFTIRTTVTTLREALKAPGTASALRATLATVPDDVVRYKGWRPLLGAVDRLLAARGEG